MSKYIIYGKEDCRYCEMAKQFLDMRGVDYTYLDLANTEGGVDYLKSLGLRSVPQIWYTGEGGESVHVGGYTELGDHMLSVM